ncbi:hypothetical protein HN789_02660 [archaeon]|nr:hypothetical protein [archaeon]MBT7440117.1 hypothetical protein [archaeon]
MIKKKKWKQWFIYSNIIPCDEDIGSVKFKKSYDSLILSPHTKGEIENWSSTTFPLQIDLEHKIGKDCLSRDGEKSWRRSRSNKQKFGDFFYGTKHKEMRLLYDYFPSVKETISNAFSRGLGYSALSLYVFTKMALISADNALTQVDANVVATMAFLATNYLLMNTLGKRNALSHEQGPLKLLENQISEIADFRYSGSELGTAQAHIEATVSEMNKILAENDFEQLNETTLVNLLITKYGKNGTYGVEREIILQDVLNELDKDIHPEDIRAEAPKNLANVNLMNKIDAIKTASLVGLTYATNYFPISLMGSKLLNIGMQAGSSVIQAARYRLNGQVSRMFTYLHSLGLLRGYMDEANQRPVNIDRDALSTRYWGTVTNAYNLGSLAGGIAVASALRGYNAGHTGLADAFMLTLLGGAAVYNWVSSNKAHGKPSTQDKQGTGLNYDIEKITEPQICSVSA